MTWFDSILDLQYYHQPKGVPCFCELVAIPSDMYLQGLLPSGNGSYTLKLYVYSPDGLAQYEDATTYFDYFFGKAPNGQHFFNARLKAYSSAMCAHECYIIRAVVTQSGGQVLFDKYTERYCQNDCCNTATGIVFDQVGFASGIVAGTDISDPTYNHPPDGTGIPTISPTITIPAGGCGEPLIRIITRFDCIDKFTGSFFGTSDVVLGGGSAFEYRQITTIRGRLVRKPREIKRELSYNCKLQRTESTAQYLLEGFEYLPAWKMNEIEAQLHANHIYIDDFKQVREFQYAGGTPMRQLRNCFELFKLETYLEDCTQRQIFGCDTECDKEVQTAFFAIPAAYQGGAFYNEQKELVGHDYDMLLEYLRNMDGVTDVEDVDISALNCQLHKVVSITGQRYIPSSIYYDEAVSAYKVHSQYVNDVSALCDNAAPYCARPVATAFATEEAVCATPVNGALETETINPLDVTVVGYGDWEETEADTYASLYNTEVTLNIKVVNDQITEDPEDTEAVVEVYNMIIGVIGGTGRPAVERIVRAADFASMPEDASLTVDPSGIIRYSGEVTAQSSTDVTIELTNIKYTL